MGSYHQMGHHSINLLKLIPADEFDGVILSPLNYKFNELSDLIKKWDGPSKFEFIFDPQLYNAKLARESLKIWKYYPSDFETADPSSKSWWSRIIEDLAKVVIELGCDGVCSPVIQPRTGSDSYYDLCVWIADELSQRLPDQRTYLTTYVKITEMGEAGKANKIGSILSRTSLDHIYLVIESDQEPRRELNDLDGIKGIMKLINLLSESGLEVTVSHASSDVILWKAAGAESCCTGKFFNLRRFTRGRFEDPGSGGGGQLPYWFEESLIAFLRETDIIRVNDARLLNTGCSKNKFSNKIIFNVIKPDTQTTAWLGDSWLHYLTAFSCLEGKVSRNDVELAKELTRTAERNWQELEDKDILMEEARNNGQWLRVWRRALIEFKK